MLKARIQAVLPNRTLLAVLLVVALFAAVVTLAWAADIGTYDQCANDTGGGYAAGDTGCRWINGNLNGNNSFYSEGDATVQRLWLTGFVPGSTHTIELQYGTTKNGKHAYDFLTRWNWSEDWIVEADRCQGINGCVGYAETVTPIPVDSNAGGFDAAADSVQQREFVMRGGTLISATTPAIASGNYTGDSETRITVTFTVAGSGNMCETKGSVTTCGVVLWFGAHVAAQVNWGTGNGAGDIPGSPYHVALKYLDGGAIGDRDNQMATSALIVLPPGTIIIVKDAVPDNAQEFSFNLNNGSTISQDFVLNDDGGADATPNSKTFSVRPGTWYAAEVTIPANWALSALICDDPTNDTAVDFGNARAIIAVASNETVTCTFYDSMPTAVKLGSFTATGAKKAITLNWQTLNEGTNLGFNLYRAEAVDGERTQINAGLIPTNVPPGSAFGAVYAYRDGTVHKGITYYYWLEDVNIYGGTGLHGPVEATLGWEPRVIEPPVWEEPPITIIRPPVQKVPVEGRTS